MEAVRAGIEKELKELEENEDSISSVKRMKKEEKLMKQKMSKSSTGNTFGAEQEQAARVLIHHMRLFVQRHRQKRGIPIQVYTKEELAAIDAKLISGLKDIVEAGDAKEPGNDESIRIEFANPFDESARKPIIIKKEEVVTNDDMWGSASPKQSKMVNNDDMWGSEAKKLQDEGWGKAPTPKSTRVPIEVRTKVPTPREDDWGVPDNANW